MSTPYTGKRQIREVRNPNVYLNEADAAAFERVRAARFARVDKEQALLRAARPTAEIHALRATTDAVLTHAIPDFSKTRAKIVEDFTPIFRKLYPETVDLRDIDLQLAAGEFDFRKTPPKLAPPTGVSELWWAHTQFFCSVPGLTIDLPDDRIHLFGHVAYNSDPLFTGSCGYIENYVLSSDRFPPTPKTSLAIDTETRIGGIISGWTGMYHPIWHADDKWCKCWQVSRKTAYLSTGQILANVENAFQFIDLHNVDPVGQANASLFAGYGGLLKFDANLSALKASGTSILVDIETRYDFQLEGESDLWFRYTGGSAADSVPSVNNAVLLKSKAMFLQPYWG